MSLLCVKTPSVIFFGECEVLITTEPVKLKRFEELKRVTKRVEIDDWTVGNGKVLIDGTLFKNVEYKRDDKLIGAKNFTIPFACCADAPGAFEGDRVQIEGADVVVEKEHFGIPPNPTDYYPKFWEKVCIRIIFKVLRDVQVTVDTVEPNICP